MHDQLATGRKIRMLTMVDTTRGSRRRLIRGSASRGGCCADPGKVRAEVGYPRTIRVDQGTEFVSRDLDLWGYTRGVTLDFARPDQGITL